MRWEQSQRPRLVGVGELAVGGPRVEDSAHLAERSLHPAGEAGQFLLRGHGERAVEQGDGIGVQRVGFGVGGELGAKVGADVGEGAGGLEAGATEKPPVGGAV